MTKILFVNHKEKRCGIHQYGWQIFNVINSLNEHEFFYAECDSRKELHEAIEKSGCEMILYNYHYRTMPFLHSIPFFYRLPFLHWLRLTAIPGLRRLSFIKYFSDFVRKPFAKQRPFLLPSLRKKYNTIIHMCLLHYMDQQMADTLDDQYFQYYIYGDPTLVETNPRVFKTGRLIKEYINTKPIPKIPIIGSYGFGGAVKGFDYLVELVQKEFDEAIIRLNIPPNGVNDKFGRIARYIAEECYKKIRKPGIKLEISHEFFDDDQLLNFLASNTLNAFLYKDTKAIVLASAPDWALAVQRPIAVTKSHLFRHFNHVEPSIYIEERSLKEIIEAGYEPLKHLTQEWSAESMRSDYSKIFATIKKHSASKG